MCTPPSEVTHACLLDLDSMASRSHHGLLLCPDSQAQAICASPYKIFAHQPLPDETNKTEVLHGISQPKPRNPTSNRSRTRRHA